MKETILKLFDVNVNSELDLKRILTTLAIALLMGLVVLAVYRITYRGVMFNRNFGISLLLVALVTSIVIMPISSNLVLSLGMVGALSIVRFRTALKDPLDIVYMFWAIAVGLTAGAGFFKLTLISCFFLAAILLLIAAFQQWTGRSGRGRPYLVVIRYTDQFRGDFQKILPRHQLKSKSATAKSVELVVEVRLSGHDLKFVEQLQRSEGILSASVVQYSGDYT